MGKRILVAGAGHGGLTAAAQLLQGEVYVPESVDGRRMADKLYGYVHPCCSFPLSDVALNVPPMPFSQGFKKRSEARRCRRGRNDLQPKWPQTPGVRSRFVRKSALRHRSGKGPPTSSPQKRKPVNP